jgi:hypothetical protein
LHRKFDVRRYLTAFFIGIFAVVGSIVAIDAPANAALGDTSEIDYSLSLGSGQAIYAQDANSLDLSTNLTFEAWYKVSTNDTRVILNKENAYEFGIDPNGKFMYAFQYVGAPWFYKSKYNFYFVLEWAKRLESNRRQDHNEWHS